MCMLTLSAFRLTKRGTGRPLAGPAACACAPGACATAMAATMITNRARLAYLMRDAVGTVLEDSDAARCFVLIRPSDTEGRPHPHRDGCRQVSPSPVKEG